MKSSLFAMALVWALELALGAPETPAAPGDSGRPAVFSETSQTVVEGIIAAPVSEVWRVFSTAEGYKALGVAQARMDFRPGGLILTSYDPDATLGDEKTIQTEIITYDPGRMIATRIHQPPKGFPFMDAYRRVWTVVSLTDLGDGRTALRVAMNGYGDDEQSQAMRKFFATGNDWVLRKLQSKYLPPGASSSVSPAESPLASVEWSREVRASREAVWTALFTANGWKAFPGSTAGIGTLPGDPFEPFPAASGSRLLTLIPGELLSFSWPGPATNEFLHAHPTWVTVSLETVSPSACRVRLRHHGFAEQSRGHPDRIGEYEKARRDSFALWNQVLEKWSSQFTNVPN